MNAILSQPVQAKKRKCDKKKRKEELDPVGSTARYEMMKLCTGSVQDTMRRQQLVIGDTGSVEGTYILYLYLYIAQSGDMEGCHACLTY